MITNYSINDIPMDFRAALSKNEGALGYFSSLDSTSQQMIIAHTESIRSKEELERFVSTIDKGARIR